MSGLRFIVRRLLGAVAVMVLIAATVYAIFVLMPSDPAQLACGRPCTPQRLAEVSELMGVDQPWYLQFWDFLRGIVVGRTFGSGSAAIVCDAPCFGYSFRLRQPVSELIATRFPVTASIAVGAAVLWFVFGVGTGVLSAVKKDSVLDRSILTVSMFGLSAPAYLVALLSIFVFGFTLGWFPTGGYIPFATDPLAWLQHLILPWLVLALLHGASYTRIMRTQMLDEFGSDYIRTARSKGLSERVVIGSHATRNAIVPLVTLFGLDLGVLLGGAVLTERAFSMQGLGTLLLDAVAGLDLQLVVGITLFAALLIVLANLAVDIVHALIDPRVRRAALAS